MMTVKLVLTMAVGYICFLILNIVRIEYFNIKLSLACITAVKSCRQKSSIAAETKFIDESEY